MKKLLFVCVENSNRSQMAQAFAKIHGAGKVEAFSAGSKPSGKVNPRAINAMKKIGYDLASHDSKSLDEIPDGPYEYVVGMGCGDACPWVKTNNRIDWEIPDPREMDEHEFAGVRDIIEEKVKALLNQISAK
ncbi:MAG: arsenate reductase ArsC [Bacteroidetes bacterium]|nr:arsenate reductase ArsC [Bacteroidota bacterium]